MPPKADSRAERAVGVVAKARPRNCRPPRRWPRARTGWFLRPIQGPFGSFGLRRRKSAQRLCSKIRRDVAGYTEPRMMETGKRDRLRSLPAVDAVLRDPSGLALADHHGRARATRGVREALADLRRRISAGERPEVSEKAVVDVASELLAGRGLVRVVNATGVYCTPTWAARSSRTGGPRGPRGGHRVLQPGIRPPLRRQGIAPRPRGAALGELTGAEDALVVNNCAGATLLALSALVASEASGAPEVIVSRGQLIEIGGAFASPRCWSFPARLREVGTTNRTRLSDYESAINENTRAVLWVHPSNFERSASPSR